MKTIMVPTDFSKPSKVAVSYALGLAKKTDARVVLVSVISSSAPDDGPASWKVLEANMIKTSQRDAIQLMSELKAEKGKTDVSYQYVVGFPVVDKIEEFAVKNKVNLIVMGTKGASGLDKILLGSNATAVIDNSSVPVIVVPGDAKFKSIKKLVYATDVKNFPKELRAVGGFAQMVGASVEVLHVVPEEPLKKEVKGDVAKIAREKLIEMARYPKIHLHVARAKDVAKGVDKFVTDQKADMVAMFTHRLGFREKVFGRSVTRKLALYSNIPVLAINKSNSK